MKWNVISKNNKKVQKQTIRQKKQLEEITTDEHKYSSSQMEELHRLLRVPNNHLKAWTVATVSFNRLSCKKFCWENKKLVRHCFFYCATIVLKIIPEISLFQVQNLVF